MDTKSQLIVADSKILPEVFTKVLEVKMNRKESIFQSSSFNVSKAYKEKLAAAIDKREPGTAVLRRSSTTFSDILLKKHCSI